jgi:hypothetical protein
MFRNEDSSGIDGSTKVGPTRQNHNANNDEQESRVTPLFTIHQKFLNPIQSFSTSATVLITGWSSSYCHQKSPQNQNVLPF